MTRITRIVADQQVVLSDYQNLAHDPRNLVDALIATAIQTGKAYAGATVTKIATTKIAIETPLYVFDSGALYSRDGEDVIEIDLLAALPTTGNQRIVAIVAQGAEQADETEERDFATGVVNNVIQTEARPTATRLFRRAAISTVAGAQAPQPALPLVDSALVVIAYITLSSTEIIEGGIAQNIENRVVPLSTAVNRLKVVEEFVDIADPLIAGLKSDIAKLAADTSASIRNVLTDIMENVARINEQVGIDRDAAFSASDYFLDTTDSDTTHINYLAKVEEGIRFADDNTDTDTLSLSNPGDTRVVIHGNGLLLPKYETTPLIDNIRKDNEIALSNAGSQTVNYTKRTVARSRLRYGDIFKKCTNSAWWKSGRYDVAKGIFERNGETFQVLPGSGDPTKNHKWIRLQKIWVDTYEEIYWDRLVTTASYTGNIASQTFLSPRAAWLTHVELAFSRLDTSGDVRLMICKVTEVGTPDPKNILADVLIPHASLKLFPLVTQVSIGPIYLEAGVRYGFIVSTPGNHWLCISENNKFAQGSYFVSTDGAWFQGDISRDIAFRLLVAEFEAPRVVVDLNDWNLSGGVAGIDLSLEQVAPGPATIEFEVKNGSGPWVALAEATVENGVFAGLPASLDARMVLIGTTEVMPGIMLANSQVTRMRPRTSLTHISAARTTPVNVDEVEIVAVLESYDETPHDCAAQLLVGVGYGTPVNPTATTNETLPDGSIRRRFIFTGITPTTTYKRKITGSTTSALAIFLVSSVTDIAFPA